MVYNVFFRNSIIDILAQIASNIHWHHTTCVLCELLFYIINIYHAMLVAKFEIFITHTLYLKEIKRNFETNETRRKLWKAGAVSLKNILPKPILNSKLAKSCLLITFCLGFSTLSNLIFFLINFALHSAVSLLSPMQHSKTIWLWKLINAN